MTFSRDFLIFSLLYDWEINVEMFFPLCFSTIFYIFHNFLETILKFPDFYLQNIVEFLFFMYDQFLSYIYYFWVVMFTLHKNYNHIFNKSQTKDNW